MAIWGEPPVDCDEAEAMPPLALSATLVRPEGVGAGGGVGVIIGVGVGTGVGVGNGVGVGPTEIKQLLLADTKLSIINFDASQKLVALKDIVGFINEFVQDPELSACSAPKL